MILYKRPPACFRKVENANRLSPFLHPRLHVDTKIALFKGKSIPKTLHDNEWWFVITDVVAALTDSVQPDGYIKDMRRRDPELTKGWGQIATPLLIETSGGPQRLNCASTEGIFTDYPIRIA